jgi:uncharacterized membrane protein
MERTEKSIEIGVPVHTAYNQWTQFEEFPRFMDGVKEVRQLDDTHLHWRASVAGKEKEWDAVITEQVPDRVISWRSTSARSASSASRRTARACASPSSTSRRPSSRKWATRSA